MKFRLRGKTVVLILLFACLLSAVALIAGILFMNRVIDEHYRDDVDVLSRAVAITVDRETADALTQEVMRIYRQTEDKVDSSEWGTPAFYDYLAHYDGIRDSEDFKRIRARLAQIQDSCEVSSVYLFALDEETTSAIYIVDASEGEDFCPPGCIDQVFFSNYEVFSDPDRGFPPYITNTEEYGWLVTAGAPVHDADGRVICYAGVDIPMEVIREKQRNFILITSGLLLFVTIVIALCGAALIDHNIVSPIKKLSDAAQKYCEEDSDTVHDKFSALRIRTGDEIEMLADSMKQMERDLNEHIAKVVETRTRLISTMREAEKMGRIATMDSLTGIRNKTAYENEKRKIQEEMACGNDRIGVVMIDLNYLKSINDTCGHDKGDQAIKHLCQLICATYQHSPVFRIGGDEFVAILKGRDLENAKRLNEKFEQTIEALSRDESREPWERTSAAVGCAFFDPDTDRNYEDVFKRADALMYERKKEMKAGRT